MISEGNDEEGQERNEEAEELKKKKIAVLKTLTKYKSPLVQGKARDPPKPIKQADIELYGL
jgi:hypothetical protein